LTSTSEGVDRRPDRRLGLGAVGDVEGDGARPLGVALHEVGELLGVARCGHELVTGLEHCLGQGTAEAAGAAGDEPGAGHVAYFVLS
jgi:hypothetical protein